MHPLLLPPLRRPRLTQRVPTANILSSLLIGLVLVVLYALHKAEDNAGAEVDRWYAPVSQQLSH